MLIDDKQQYASQNQVKMQMEANVTSNDNLIAYPTAHHFFGSEFGSREQIHQEGL